MLWRLLPHATLCVASGRLILLDVRQDRYSLLPTALADPMRRWLSEDALSPLPAPLLRLFQAGGVVRAGDPPTVHTQEYIRIPQTLAAPPPCLPTSAWRSASRVGAAVGRTWLELRLRPLEAILNRVTQRRIRGAPAGTDRLVKQSALYDAARRYSPFARSCLLDSLALDAWLAGGDCGRRLVFGVTAEPFGAHCWLQTPHAILNDSYERVSRYTPILSA